MNLQSIALYATLGYLLQTQEFTWDTWQFWCFLSLFIAGNHVARIQTQDELVEPIREAVAKLEAERRRLGHTTPTQDTEQ